MKIKISYFYQIRNFQPYMIPVSTAMYDPSWFHNKPTYAYYDSRGVLNGLRVDTLSPSKIPHTYCSKDCPQKFSQTECDFIREYKKYLNSLNFDKMYNYLKVMSNLVKKTSPYIKDNEEVEVILIVHEAPNNPCSERGPLIEWFKNNGVELEEFSTKD